MKRCSPKPALSARPLLNAAQASGLEDLFKVLANDSRLRLLHSLARHDEMCVGDLAEELGLSPQAVSNQLRRLRGIVAAHATATTSTIASSILAFWSCSIAGFVCWKKCAASEEVGKRHLQRRPV